MRSIGGGVEFSESEYYGRLTDEQKMESEFVVMSFVEYMYTYHDLKPLEWDEKGVEDCCLYTLPRKISAGESYFKAVAPVLSAFFDFLGEKGLLSNAADLARRVREIDGEIVENASNPRNWGMAKSLVMAAIDAGVDITSEKEMNNFIRMYNLQMFGELGSIVSMGSKVGRNDPCPCGSGKEYKKCCLKSGKR
jgi:hypothetical protein